MNKTIYKKFAKVAVKVGINLKKGQDVIINISTRQSEFAKYLTEECYKAHARKVSIEWHDEEISKLSYKYADTDVLANLNDWEIEKAKYQAETIPCRIYVDDDDPNAYEGLDTKKIITINQSRRKALKKYRDMTESKDQWVIIALPSQAWANMVFPNEKPRIALKKLWEAIIKTSRLDGKNPLSDWKEHVKELKNKSQILNELNLDYLKYESSNGTDLTIKLHPMHLWQAASEKNIRGIEFVANIPTEEVFTMPLKDGVNGVVHSTKPLSYNGNIIDDFTCYFENGKCVKATAKTGLDVLNSIINADESSAYLGEVALVPYDSPINQTGLLFYNTLFDENACCHLAFGMAFKDNIRGYEKMTDEDFNNINFNNSVVHVDFMIGSSDLSIKGYDHNGKEYIIFRNGVWAI
ncbi:MAG: aminopeptidase [Anaeroplasmataceae bacterium]